MAEAPYGVIWKLLKEGRVVPILGAGTSYRHILRVIRGCRISASTNGK